MSKRFKKITAVVFVVSVAVLCCGCNSKQSPTSLNGGQSSDESSTQNVALGKAIAAQNFHVGSLMQMAGVVGTASMVDEFGQPKILVMTKQTGLSRLPVSLEGIAVVEEVTGEIRALAAAKTVPVVINPASRFARPVPIGVSTGNQAECLAGTISARTKDASGALYALSNNHVFALENTAALGSNCSQPGTYDAVPQCAVNAADIIGTLFAFTKIVMSTSNTTNNIVDAAIVLTTSGIVGNATPSNGYGTPLSQIMNVVVRQNVQKYGRTTGLTKGYVYAVNVIVNIGYSSGTARFVNQIWVKSSSSGAFIKAGDSGSLLVTNPGKNPVGLLFAGDQTGKNAFANPIGPVLDSLHVTIDGQ